MVTKIRFSLNLNECWQVTRLPFIFYIIEACSIYSTENNQNNITFQVRVRSYYVIIISTSSFLEYLKEFKKFGGKIKEPVSFCNKKMMRERIPCKESSHQNREVNLSICHLNDTCVHFRYHWNIFSWKCSPGKCHQHASLSTGILKNERG